MLRHLDVEQLRVLVEIVHNILQGIIPLTPPNRKRLGKYKQLIRRVTKQGLTQRVRLRALTRLFMLIPIFIKEYFRYDSGNGIDTERKI